MKCDADSSEWTDDSSSPSNASSSSWRLAAACSSMVLSDAVSSLAAAAADFLFDLWVPLLPFAPWYSMFTNTFCSSESLSKV